MVDDISADDIVVFVGQLSARPWYGSWALVAAVSSAVAVLGVTPLLLLDTSVVAVLCIHGVETCRIPAWVVPIEWLAWAGGAAAAAVGVTAAQRAAKTSRPSSLAPPAVLLAVVCIAGLVLMMLLWKVDATLIAPPD
jgi:hypothetical protein